MTDEPFLLDSNILVYAFDSSEGSKYSVARALVKDCWDGKIKYAVSLQNLSEFFVNITKKIKNPIAKERASDFVKTMLGFKGLIKLEPRKETVSRALDICILADVSYWDALIAATMLEHGIFHIYTEDTKGFSRIAGINAKNPFV